MLGDHPGTTINNKYSSSLTLQVDVYIPSILKKITDILSWASPFRESSQTYATVFPLFWILTGVPCNNTATWIISFSLTTPPSDWIIHQRLFKAGVD